MELEKKKCKPCEGGMPSLNQSEIDTLMAQLKSDWKLLDNKLSKEFACVNFKHTIDFVNKIAVMAEEEGHHPVMHVYYGKVIVELWTHAINGLTENDFILAAKIEQL
jgi:4a-hydroxytetrahydrobiopterin dehydratase